MAGFDETLHSGFDYLFKYAGFWGVAKELAGFIFNTDMTTFHTVAPSKLLQIPASTTIDLGKRAYWILGVWHDIPNSNIKLDFWHRDSRAAPAGIWGKKIYYWRYDQAVMTTAWSVDAGTDPANTWLQVTGLNIPTGVSTWCVIYFTLEALTTITNAAISVWYDDIRVYT